MLITEPNKIVSILAQDGAAFIGSRAMMKGCTLLDALHLVVDVPRQRFRDSRSKIFRSRSSPTINNNNNDNNNNNIITTSNTMHLMMSNFTAWRRILLLLCRGSRSHLRA